MIDTWEKSKKIFRYINRVTFTHPEIPVKLDISIVKNSTTKDKRVIPVYTTSESGVFENAEVYEIELEVNNSMNTSFIINNRIILSTIKKTAVIGCINDVFDNLKDFDVALLHCPHGTLYCQFSDFININEITSKINFLNNDQNITDFSCKKNQVINLYFLHKSIVPYV